MRVSSTIKALRERCPSLSKRVYGALQWVSLSVVHPEKLPCAYVFTQSEDPKTLQSSENSYKQLITATIAVVLCVPSLDVRGQEGADKIEDLKDEVFKALLGWAPNSDPQCVYEYANYRVIDTSSTPAMWCVQLEFTVEYMLDTDDTYIKTEHENIGNFDKFYADVDKIESDKPDGNIDAKLRLTGLTEGRAKSEPQDQTIYKDLW
jgi:hypothetical protein